MLCKTPLRRSIYFIQNISMLIIVLERYFLIFCWNDFMYLIWTSFGSYFNYIYDVTLNSVMFCVNFIILLIYLNSFLYVDI